MNSLVHSTFQYSPRLGVSNQDDQEKMVREITSNIKNVTVKQSDTIIEKKPDIFNTDIEKIRILVETHNISNKSSAFDPSNFEYELFNSNNNTNQRTGGQGVYKNVIGFKLIKAIIPNKAYTITKNNNVIIYNASLSGSSTEIGPIKLTLPQGYFPLENIPTAFSETVLSPGASFTMADGTSLSSVAGGAANASKVKITENSVTFDNYTKKFTLSASDTTAKIRFDWNTAHTTYNSMSHRLFGFYNTNSSLTNAPYNYSTASASITSEFVPDASVNYIDLIVKEIPYKACKHNSNGYSVVDRIPFRGSYGDTIHYENLRDLTNEMFLPITLHKLSIELRDPMTGFYHDAQEADCSFEFELTIAKNTDELNLFRG
jgi:hypothetical protein